MGPRGVRKASQEQTLSKATGKVHLFPEHSDTGARFGSGHQDSRPLYMTGTRKRGDLTVVVMAPLALEGCQARPQVSHSLPEALLHGERWGIGH